MSWIKKLADVFGGNILTGVKEIIDESFTSDEERMEAVLKLEQEKLNGVKLDLEFVRLMVKNTISARDSNVKIQVSKNSSWLAKNTPYLLAIFCFVGFFGLLILQMFIEVPEGNINTMNIMIGVLGTIVVTIIGFFFGSSLKKI